MASPRRSSPRVSKPGARAHRAGIDTLLLPARNRKDYEEIPESARRDLEFVWLENVDDALEVALVQDEECVAAVGTQSATAAQSERADQRLHDHVVIRRQPTVRS